ncbi:putative DLD2-D-lactate dehydrogenase [Cantharellus anzutake]|uniref:putative DLD2-D-lactate dehydrogenase n=1 Tax=Cantharellus anzutake TaxID=1750568 RepID=UPI0019035CD3|nr:putative DLD2-D-lactate dehydrogenase [Cantharellus anzutake]KAF8332344.1 putative DLD2-D-lactate dehydrogenase [Cantharellus anzutake]
MYLPRITTRAGILCRPPRRIPTGLRGFRTSPIVSLNAVTGDDIKHFKSFLPDSAIISTLAPGKASNDDLVPFNHDWLEKYIGKSKCVLKPRSTEEVSKIMKHCYERRIAIVPQGGNTGLVGGGVPTDNEVILNLGNMNNVRSFDPVSGVLVADAGCILENLTNYLEPYNHIMPLDLGAKGSCHIGGNVATNAGGLRLLRYGSLRGTVLGLEVVLPNGEILGELKTLRKDNTGYDIKQLFIGSEGTLGVITGVAILTPPAPAATSALLLSLPSFSKVKEVFRTTKTNLGEILSAFEYFDRNAYDLVRRHTGKDALDEGEVGDSEAFVLIETSGGKREHDEAKLEEFLEQIYAKEDFITSGVQSQSQDDFLSLWSFRELIPEAAGKMGKVYKYDISVPVSEFKAVTDTVRKHLKALNLIRAPGEEKGGGAKVIEVIGYGHFGDGNLHLNVIAEAFTSQIEAALEPFVYEVVESLHGSISAEHGIGLMKTHALQYSKGEVSRRYMKRIKQVFDERGIMNPGKVFEID